MSSDDENPAAGWYSVEGVGERYWDGEAWTPRTRATPQASSETGSEAAPAVIPAQPPNASQLMEQARAEQGSVGSDGSAPVTSPAITSTESLEPSPKSRSRRKGLGIGLALVLLAGGGGGTAYAIHEHQVSEAHQEAAAKARAAAEKRKADAAAAAKAAEAAKEAELKRERAAYQACRRQLLPLTNSLSAIDSRLNVGLTQAELSTAVGDASIAYDRISIHRLGEGTCLSSGAKLEEAFNQYATTSSTWNDCITNLYCDTDSILPGMQKKWATATRDIARAKHLMQELNPDSPLFQPDSTAGLNS